MKLIKIYQVCTLSYILGQNQKTFSYTPLYFQASCDIKCVVSIRQEGKAF